MAKRRSRLSTRLKVDDDEELLVTHVFPSAAFKPMPILATKQDLAKFLILKLGNRFTNEIKVPQLTIDFMPEREVFCFLETNSRIWHVLKGYSSITEKEKKESS